MIQKVKVRSTVKCMPTPLNGLVFISREITKYTLDFEAQKCTLIIKEVLFDEITEDEITTRTNLSTFREYAAPKVVEEEISTLFTLLNHDILTTDLFHVKFRELLEDILLMDTQGLLKNEPPMYGLEINEWEKDIE
ncbi:MAG: hypothetical protein ACSHXA_07470 [Polaribacter sp.]|uniref:hypothetical protein n=1 Tax=Polaribacter sp. TaxID=1920175 RepID=UPI003EF504CF